MANYKALEKLKRDRVNYSNLVWRSGGGSLTKITDMSDEYLLNALRAVHKKLGLAKTYPLIEEFQKYDDVPYTYYSQAMYTEYQYRKVSEAIRIEELEVLKQEQYDYEYGKSSFNWNDYSYHKYW